MQVGFARADVTPAVGKEVPGSLSKRHGVTIHDPLYASAMVVDDGTGRVALVGLDALSVKRSVVEAARRVIEAQTGIPGDHVMVGASHTHNGGPSAGALPGKFARAFDPELCEQLAQGHATAPDPDYLRELSAQIATAVIVADERKQDALLWAGRGHEDTVAHNRRFKMKDGTQTTHPGKGNPDIVEVAGPIDPEVGVLGAWTPGGELLGAVINYTLHGTVFGGGISSDWPHWMREIITDALNPDAVVVFLNGACGDVTQVNNLSLQERESGEKWARRIGHRVGGEVIRVLADAEPGETPPVAAAQRLLRIRTREVSEERFEQALQTVRSEPPQGGDWIFARDAVLLHECNRWEPEVTCEVQAVQVGPAAFVSNPGEYFCEYGLRIKQRSNFPYTWVVELANGCIGYVPTPEALGPQGGGYEPRLAMSSKLVPEAGAMIEDASVDLLSGLTPGAEPPRPAVQQAGNPWAGGASSARKT